MELHEEDKKQLEHEDCIGYSIQIIVEGEVRGVFSGNRLEPRRYDTNDQLIKAHAIAIQACIDSKVTKEEEKLT